MNQFLTNCIIMPINYFIFSILIYTQEISKFWKIQNNFKVNIFFLSQNAIYFEKFVFRLFCAHYLSYYQ